MPSSLVPTLLALCLSAVPQDSPQGQADQKTAVEMKVKEFYSAVANKDWAALRACFLPNGIWVLPEGRSQKADDIIAFYESGTLAASAEEPSQLVVRHYDDVASAWVTAREAIVKEGAAATSANAARALDLFLFARRDGEWK